MDFCSSIPLVLPVIDYATKHKPFWLDSVAVESFLQVFGVVHAFVLLAVRGSILEGWRFIHVILAHVVPVHGGMVDV